MKVKSKALEANIAEFQFDVTIDEKYSTLQEVMSKYYGLMEGLNTFLKELSHPLKNWRFIVVEARKYALEYFHLLKNHPKGPQAARLLVNIFSETIESNAEVDAKADAIDNLILFLQKILKDSGSSREKFVPLVDDTFEQIYNLSDELFDLFVRSYYQINRLANYYLDSTPRSPQNFKAINSLLIKYFQRTYDYWLNEGDPLFWFMKDADGIAPADAFDEIFQNISHEQLRQWKIELDQIEQQMPLESEEVLKRLLRLPGFSQIVEEYRHIPRALLQKGDHNRRGHHLKLLFLFHIMNVSGLSLIHEETLRDINQTLTWIISNENYRIIQNLIRKTFSILKERATAYPATALNCVLNMGKGVYKTDELDLVNFFIDSLIDFGFQAPMIEGVDNEWKIKVNSYHILNIRIWLELIELKPKWSYRLLSGLIIHLSLCGIFIRDIDLFPRDITRLLNSGIGPVYNLAKQLTRLFPTYFNDIGAEGRLRDISTRIDEVAHRRDILVHFLRKQSHVESSNRIIPFMQAIFKFWLTRDKECLTPFVPPSIYEQIDPEGPFVDGMNHIMTHLQAAGVTIPDDFLFLHDDKIKQQIYGISDVSDVDLERFEHAITLYKLLNLKYNLNYLELEGYISQLKTEALPDLNRLEVALVEPDSKKRLYMILDYLEKLKGIVLSDKPYEIREDIYKKRHITIDIPSMYGSYHEMKFDCLGLTLRLESMVNVLFEALIEDIDLNLITKATFYQIYSLLRLFDKALKLDGILSLEYERQLEFLAHSLEVKGFTQTQYLDIFKGFAQAVKKYYQ